jgi:hypothetical protein
MKALHQFAAFFTIVAAMTLLFVVVCPLTPTPIAVVNPHHTGISAPVLATVQVLGLLLICVRRSLPANSPAMGALLQQPQSPRPGHGKLVDVLCARLC